MPGVLVNRQKACLEVVLDDIKPAADVWQRDCHLSVKSAWPGQCTIQLLLQVCGPNDYHTLIRLKAIHLYQQLVERLG